MAFKSPVNGSWYSTTTISQFSFRCGHCGDGMGAHRGYIVDESRSLGNSGRDNGYPAIIICATCNRPNFFVGNGWQEQSPSPMLGRKVASLPDDIEFLYNEARTCTTIAAYTSCILACRKLLMHLAVQKGAETNLKFFQYVKYLAEKGWIPPDGMPWVDQIRDRGNEANHEIVHMTQEDADVILSFVEMLLIFMYEFPAKHAATKAISSTQT